MQRRRFLHLSLAGLGTACVMGHGAPAQLIPRPGKDKWAVVFGTWYGTARDAGVWISEGMGGIAAVFDARQKPDLAAFDHLVLGTAIQGGKGPREFSDLIQANAAAVQGKVRGLFAVCGNLEKPVGAEQKKTYIDDYLAALCKADAGVPGRVFNGRITKVLMSPEDYKIVEDLYQRLGLPPLKDYDLLRRPDCLEFGRSILERLPPG